jgi:hypothetical protein
MRFGKTCVFSTCIPPAFAIVASLNILKINTSEILADHTPRHLGLPVMDQPYSQMKSGDLLPDTR